MKVTRLPDVERGSGRSVAVGTFDGVHLGHREVISGADSVLTFDPHPVSVVAPQHTPKLLTTLERKAELIASLGVRGADRDPVRRASSPARSAARVHRRRARRARSAPRRSSIGENFRFGHKAQGDPRLLAADERFATVVHPLLEVDGEIVSSSHIRGLVLAGEVGRGQPAAGRAASSCAARSCTATSAGASSASRPPTSFPTRRSRAPATASTRAWPRATAIGRAGGREHRRAPDLQDRRGELIEAYILDFDGDLYGSDAAPGLPRAPARRAALRDPPRR